MAYLGRSYLRNLRLKDTDMKEEIDKHVPIEQCQDATSVTELEDKSKKWLRGPWIPICVFITLLVGTTAYISPLEIIRGVVIYLSEDTEYAPGYSESAFRQISIGNTETSVKKALGNPLTESYAESYIRWLYAPDPIPEFEEDGEYPDMRYSFTTIDFAEDGTFVDAFGQISHGSSSTLLGTSGSGTILADGGNFLSITNAQIKKLKSEKATSVQIEAKFGKPQAVFESRAVKWLQYSHSPGSKNYRQRLIGIDRDGKVCRKIDAIWWD